MLNKSVVFHGPSDFRIWGLSLTSSMNLGRHSISSTNPIQFFDVQFDADCQIFTTSAPAGFAIYRTYPLQLIRKRGILGPTKHSTDI